MLALGEDNVGPTTVTLPAAVHERGDCRGCVLGSVVPVSLWDWTLDDLPPRPVSAERAITVQDELVQLVRGMKRRRLVSGLLEAHADPTNELHADPAGRAGVLVDGLIVVKGFLERTWAP